MEVKLSNHIEDKVREFVLKYGLGKSVKLSLDTQIGKLGLDGDDALEFMTTFAEKFNVNMDGFDFDKHFGPEAGFNPFLFMYYLLLDKEKLHRIPITVGDLTEAAKNGKWKA